MNSKKLQQILTFIKAKSTVLASVFLMSTHSIYGQDFELVKDYPDESYINGDVNHDFTEYNNKLYFRADDGLNGRELWVTDGTTEGTIMLKDVYPNGGGLHFSAEFTKYNEKLYFRANDNVHLHELWVTDGTEVGTEMLKDINPNGSGRPASFTEYNGKLYFSAQNEMFGSELWVTDGTEVGTEAFSDINTDGDGSVYPTQYNDKLYFKANDGINGFELWVTDGTEDGTEMLKDINAEGNAWQSYSDPSYTQYNGKLYFTADDGINGKELWITDGTEDGTQILKNINPTEVGFNLDGNPEGFIEYNGKLYFSATDGVNGRELWVTDGTEDGTQMLKDISPDGDGNPEGFVEYNGKLCFSANDGVNGNELWETDGTEVGTEMIKDINPEGTGNPGSFTEYNGKLYFSALNEMYGSELWVTDGTEAGTQKIQPGGATYVDPKPLGLSVFNGSLYFMAAYDGNGRELWKLTTEDTSTGITFQTLSDSVAVYPNPVKDVLTLTAQESINSVAIVDLLGEVVYQSNYNDLSVNIDTSFLQKAIYIAKISTRGHTETVRIVKN